MKHLYDALAAAFLILVMVLLAAFATTSIWIDPFSPEHRGKNVVIVSDPDPHYYPELQKPRWERE